MIKTDKRSKFISCAEFTRGIRKAKAWDGGGEGRVGENKRKKVFKDRRWLLDCELFELLYLRYFCEWRGGKSKRMSCKFG